MSVQFDRFKDTVSSSQPHQSQSTHIDLGSSKNGLAGADFCVSEARKWQTAAFFARSPTDSSMLARFHRFKDWFRLGGLHWCELTQIEPAFSENKLERPESDVRKPLTEPFGAENDPEKPDSTGFKAFSEWHWNDKAFFYLRKNGYYDPLNRLL